MRRRVVVLIGLMGMTCLSLVAPPASAAADYSSFFWQRDLSGAGWAACEKPMTWSVDTRGLTTRQSRREVKRLSQAWALWSAASGVAVRYVGRESLRFDPATNGLIRSDGTAQPDRHVYLALKTSRQVPIMTRGVVGLAMPSIVMIPSREIVAGVAIFRRGFVLDQRKVDPDHVLHVYLHELGHVMGLGHARRQDNVMYPSLDHLIRLGAGDRAGAAALTQPCSRVISRAAVTVTAWME